MTAFQNLTCLTISNLSFSYRNNTSIARSKRVLQNINLNLTLGEITYILGPNGAGKSTLVNCITGILPNYNGEINISPDSILGALLDDPYVYPALKVRENIRMFLRYHKMEYGAYHDRLNQYLEIDELLEKRYKKLSQGQRQRVLLFLSMINDPDILLLDEPFNGLDPFYTEKLIALLLRLTMDDRIILINDHIISHTMRLAAQIAFLIRHELIYVLQPSLLASGLYYLHRLKGAPVSPVSLPFAECIKEIPPPDQVESVPITDLTELYTLAVNHGRNKVI